MLFQVHSEGLHCWADVLQGLHLDGGPVWHWLFMHALGSAQGKLSQRMLQMITVCHAALPRQQCLGMNAVYNNRMNVHQAKPLMPVF